VPRVVDEKGSVPFFADLDVASYRKAVEAIAEEIAAGELYQACLTYRIDRPFPGDPWQLYRALRRRDPAPFAAYLELPEVAIASSSPERFLRVDDAGRVESRPIKGTAPRAADPDEDARAARALACSEKDRAENLMIVDLVRNDLGRVCAAGSVAVPELFAVEPYASVFQLVSTVTGQLQRGASALDAIAAAFPPGSMTGAPKIAAMRALDRLETVRRGFYSGALGYLDARGGADLAVVIRTAFVRGGRAYLHAGGGIVADSDPGAEYAESLAKLRSLLAALADCSA
jgi:aminodeoxychorismate synthase component I